MTTNDTPRTLDGLTTLDAFLGQEGTRHALEAVAIKEVIAQQLADAISDIVKARKLRQADAATVLGIPQPEVSALLNYRLDGFSIARLMSFLTLLNRDVEIVIRPSRDDREGHVSVRALR